MVEKWNWFKIIQPLKKLYRHFVPDLSILANHTGKNKPPPTVCRSYSLKLLKGGPDPSHFIFEITIGMKRIRHGTSLNLIKWSHLQSICSRSRNLPFNFSVVVCRIRLFPTLISKIKWLNYPDNHLNYFKIAKSIQTVIWCKFRRIIKKWIYWRSNSNINGYSINHFKVTKRFKITFPSRWLDS